jgi:hypothetical protein
MVSFDIFIDMIEAFGSAILSKVVLSFYDFD